MKKFDIITMEEKKQKGVTFTGVASFLRYKGSVEHDETNIPHQICGKINRMED